MRPELVPIAGRMIVLEGGEGAGKTTQQDALAAWLRQRGVTVSTTFEPGATEVGRRIRDLVVVDRPPRLSPLAETFLFAADRSEHLDKVVRPGLAAGATVVTSRYVDSTIAYQAWGRGLPVEVVDAICSVSTGGLTPDLTILLDLDPVAGLARVAERGTLDQIERETVAFHRRVRQGFRSRAAMDADRYEIIDAGGSPGEIAESVRAAVLTRFEVPR